MSCVVRVENLSKRYRIGHAKEPLNLTLRDALTESAMKLGRKILRRSGSNAPQSEEFWALKNVSFDIQRGDRVGIIGRNGAGKSTLLKIMSRITQPSSGRISIAGRMASLLEVGTGFHSELTGRENIFLNGAIVGMTRAEIKRKFDEIVAFSEVERFLDTPVKRYSSGMYVRLAFAVAAHLDPEILVVDEVLSVGDAQFQKRCLGKMEAAAQEGRTVIFVSHNTQAVANLCNRGILLGNGKLIYDGEIGHALAQYQQSLAKFDSSVDLTQIDHDHRGKRQFVTLKNLSVFDGTGKPSVEFRMGDPICFRMTLQCHRPAQLGNFGVMLFNQSNSLIHEFASGMEGSVRDLAVGEHVFEIRVPKIYAYPKVYTVGAWFAERDAAQSDDYIGGAMNILIKDNDQLAHPDFKFENKAGQVFSPFTLTRLS
jgi:lipopolysaccharide transport system ATP-binding protein